MIWFVWYMSLYLLIVTLMLNGLSVDLQDMCQREKNTFLILNLEEKSNNTYKKMVYIQILNKRSNPWI